ncbi:MAG: hypothetical protein IKZ39_06605 [Lachnospiraceae bacterium]|nr:hypothetical protein [Lachnospiraceae bacterium]
MKGKNGIKEFIRNYKRTCILIPILFVSVILLGCTCGGKSGSGSGKDKYNVAGTYNLKWSIMNMYKDDYEDWRNTGDGLRDIKHLCWITKDRELSRTRAKAKELN